MRLSWADATREVLERYHSQPWLVRLYIRLRTRYYPLRHYLKYLPCRGKIVDLGCGYGLLILLLARLLPEATFLGLDTDARRIAAAKKAAEGTDRMAFMQDGWQAVSANSADAILLIDMLHHVPHAYHVEVLRAVAQSLRPGGVLLINETDPSCRERWRYWWNHLADILFYPTGPRCFFRTPEEMRDLARQAGLTLESEPLPSVFGFSTILYVGRQTEPASG